MTSEDLKLRTGRSVSEICSAAEMTEEGLALVSGALGPRELLEGLVGAELFSDAVGFLAHALPAREAVGWAFVCAKAAMGEEPSPETRAVLDATRAWVAEPSDEAGRAAMEAAEAAGLGTPAGFAGLAAFFSGANLSPPDAPPTAPDDDLAAKTVAGCINMAAVESDAEQVTESYRDFVERGLELADRIELWEAEE